jgi:hypothetical protein
VYKNENKTYRNANDYTPKNRNMKKKYILYFKDGNHKYYFITYQKSLNDAIDEGNEMSSHSYDTFIKAKYVSNEKPKYKTMAKKKRYTKSKSKNTQRGTAKSTKKYKVVMMKPSKTKIKKMYTSKRTEISPKIISFAKSCGCRVMWQVYTYRPSLKAYRLVKSGSATKSTSRVRA